MDSEPTIDVTCPNCGTEWELSKEEVDKSTFFCGECKSSFDTAKGQLISEQASKEEKKSPPITPAASQDVPERREIYYLKLLVAFVLRCFALYLVVAGLTILYDYYIASIIFDSAKPGFSIPNEFNGKIGYLQNRWGDGISLHLCHILLSYSLGCFLLAAFCWRFSIRIARLITKGFDKL
jgi:hypothetical protein